VSVVWDVRAAVRDVPDRPGPLRGIPAAIVACLVSDVLPAVAVFLGAVGADLGSAGGTASITHLPPADVDSPPWRLLLLFVATVGVACLRKAVYQRLAGARVGWWPVGISVLITIVTVRLAGIPQWLPSTVLLLAAALAIWGWSRVDARFAHGLRALARAGAITLAVLGLCALSPTVIEPVGYAVSGQSFRILENGRWTTVPVSGTSWRTPTLWFTGKRTAAFSFTLSGNSFLQGRVESAIPVIRRFGGQTIFSVVSSRITQTNGLPASLGGPRLRVVVRLRENACIAGRNGRAWITGLQVRYADLGVIPRTEWVPLPGGEYALDCGTRP
jgi:hypothetical protein